MKSETFGPVEQYALGRTHIYYRTTHDGHHLPRDARACIDCSRAIVDGVEFVCRNINPAYGDMRCLSCAQKVGLVW